MAVQLHYEIGQRVLFRTNDEPMCRERKEGVIQSVECLNPKAPKDEREFSLSILCEGETFVRDEAACIGRAA
jgi:hypothetical protein